MRHPDDAYYCHPSEVAPLFLLPNIKIMNLTLLGYHEDPNPDYFLPSGCSTVEELAFHCVDLSWEALVKLIGASKSLRSLSGLPASPQLNDLLFERYSHSLEEFDSHGLYDIIGSIHLLTFRKFERLKVLEGIHATSLVVGREESSNAPPGKRLTSRTEAQKSQQSSTSAHAAVATDRAGKHKDDTRIDDLRELLPHSLESLALKERDTVNGGSYVRTDNNAQGKLLQAVADLVEDPRFTQLKQVCPLVCRGNIYRGAKRDFQLGRECGRANRGQRC